MKKREIGLIVGILVVAAGLYGFQLLRAPRAGAHWQVRVSVDGEEYALAELSQPQRIEVRQPDGKENIVVIDGQGVYMESANCENQQCVHQGVVSPENIAGRYLGGSIVCLPNRVLVELEAEQ